MDKAEDLLRRIASTPALDALAVNPLLLRMIVYVDRTSEGHLPETRAKLYAEMCRVLIAKPRQSVLRKLAFTMMEGATQVVPSGSVAGWMRATGLVVAHRGGTEFRFAHRTFQEYLAAVHIAKTAQVRILADHMGEDWWRETTLLYAAREDAGPLIEAGLASGRPDALTLAVDCADVDPDLPSAPDDLLREAIDPGTFPERRKLAVARAALHELPKTFRLKDGTRVSSAPVARRLFELFTAVPSSGAPDQAVVGVTAAQAAAFVEWLNDNLGGNVYRLPAEQETEDPRFYSHPVIRDYSAWLAPEQDGLEPGLWSASGKPHPYAVSVTQLRERAEEDATSGVGVYLVATLAFALAHAVAVAGAIARPEGSRRSAADRLHGEFEHVGRRSLELLAASSLDDDLKRRLASRLDAGAVNDLVTEIGRAHPGALDLARARACDLAADLRLTLHQVSGGEFTASLTRRGLREPDPGHPDSLAFNRALDQDLERACRGETALGLPLCILLAKSARVPQRQRHVLDLIWGPALTAALARQPERIVLPGT